MPSHCWQTSGRKNETSFNVLAIVVLRTGAVADIDQGRRHIGIAALARQKRLARAETCKQLRIRFHYREFGLTTFPCRPGPESPTIALAVGRISFNLDIAH